MKYWIFSKHFINHWAWEVFFLSRIYKNSNINQYFPLEMDIYMNIKSFKLVLPVICFLKKYNPLMHLYTLPQLRVFSMLKDLTLRKPERFCFLCPSFGQEKRHISLVAFRNTKVTIPWGWPLCKIFLFSYHFGKFLDYVEF